MTQTLIQILGVGCAKCEKLAQNVEMAARELELDFTLEKIGDMTRILKFDLIQMPGLIVDGRVVVSGTASSVAGIKRLLLESTSGGERT